MNHAGEHGYPQQPKASAASGWLTRSRSRIGTVAAVAIAVLLAYHAVAGTNGLTAYHQKIADDKALAAQVKQLQQQNDKLQKHVEHLASDPGAIEREAYLRLHYMRPGQVAVQNDEPRSSAREASPTVLPPAK